VIRCAKMLLITVTKVSYVIILSFCTLENVLVLVCSIQTVNTNTMCNNDENDDSDDEIHYYHLHSHSIAKVVPVCFHYCLFVDTREH